jgi:hypothetical protein
MSEAIGMKHAGWLGVVAALAATVLCQGEVTYTPVVISGFPAPGHGTPFHQFGPPSLRNGNVGFVGYSSVYGVYNTAGILHRVADTSTPVPGGSGTFWAIVAETFDGASSAFVGAGINQRSGLYSDQGGQLHVVADTTTAIPSGAGNFSGLGTPAIRNGSLAFLGYGPSDFSGVYSMAGGSHRVADTVMPRPEGGNFTSFSDQWFDFDGQNAFFIGRYTGGRGIYTDAGGTLHSVVRSGDPTPAGGVFQSFANLSADQGRIAFTYTRSGGGGVASNFGGTLEIVADQNTPAPGQAVNLDLFSRASMDDGNVAFQAHFGPTELGIFARYHGELLKIIDTTDTLAGKNVKFVDMDNESFVGNQVAFHVQFDDDTEAIYVATIPEPATVAVLLLAALALPRRSRH